jgi:hypothetical protein
MFESSRIRCNAVHKLAAAFVLIIFFCCPARALQSVFLAWNPSTDSSVAGYTLFYGTNSGDYSYQIDASTNTSVEVTGLVEGQTNYFAVAAYDSQGEQSSLSAPVVYVVPGGASPAQAGSLQVSLNAPGAQWAVDDGTLQSSGATVSGLSVGSHTVSFGDVSGWTTPASQTVSVSANQTTSVTGTYVAITQTGSLEVTLNAPGAQWAVDGGTLQSSGATVSGLSVGSHTVSYSDVSGWATPASQTISVSANQTTSVTGTYVAITQTGSLEVTLNAPGAQWAVDNGSLQVSGVTISSLSLGAHTVSFSAVNGWNTPSNQTVSISANQTSVITGLYVTNQPSTTPTPTNNGTPTLADAKATYNGLFYPADAVSETNSGLLSTLTVKTNGKYSGRIILNGSMLPFAGTFDASGQATQKVARGPKLGGALTLTMALTWNSNLVQITGTVSGTNNSGWVANLLADAAATSAKSYEYTLLIPPGATAGESSPSGYGYAAITNHDGNAHVTGALADATSFNQSVPVSADGSLPLYVSIGGSELVMGWVTNLYGQAPGGEIVWIKKGSPKAFNYKSGFTNTVAVLGSIWNAPAPKHAAMEMTNALLAFAGGGLAAPLDFNVNVESNNTIVKSGSSPTNTVTGVLNPRSGLIQLTFEDGVGKTKRIAYGAFLQNMQTAAGFFVNTTNRGAFELQPSPSGTAD